MLVGGAEAGFSLAMPTNILRRRGDAIRQPDTGPDQMRAAGPRRVLIRAGTISVTAELLETPTADRIWAALPLHSSVETWGHAIQFEVPVESGREADARALAAPGDIAFSSDADRIVIAYGPTPISKAGERRLASPCNIWAKAIVDVAPLKNVTPGEKVTVTAL